MRAVFADTFYFIALLDRRDAQHAAAIVESRVLGRPPRPFQMRLIAVNSLLAASTVEASSDLSHRLPLSGGPPAYQPPNRAVLTMPIEGAASQRYFRLRPVLTPGP